MGTLVFLFFMMSWLVAIACGCIAARARLRREAQSAEGRAALLVAMTRIPCSILVEPDKTRVDA
jgi:hypothetical protein